MTASVPDYTEKEWTADGVSTAFSFQTKVLEAADIKVWLREGATLTLQTLGLHYSLSGLGDPSGVTINFVTAPASPKVVRARRQTVPKQTIDYGDLTKVPGDTTEAQLDRFAMALQDHQSAIDLELDLTGLVAAAAQSADEAAASEAAASASERSAAASAAAAGAASGRLEIAAFAELATKFVYSAPGAGQQLVAAGDVITWREMGFSWKVAAPGAVDDHLDYTGAGGVKLYVLPNGDRMYFAAFGLVGGDTDETNILQKIFAASEGYELIPQWGQTYRTTESLMIDSANTRLTMRGAAINFACVGEKRCLEIRADNVRVSGGTIRNVVGSPGFEGSFQTPIVIARYQELGGFRNVVVEDMTVETVLPGGNGIAVFGDSDNIDIRRIKFPDSPYVGIPIMSHWSFNAAEVNLGAPKVTTHQKNLRIHDITCGTLSYAPGSGFFNISAVFLSAVYNADVSNIYVKNSSRGKAVTVYAGDWGFQYATDLEKLLGSSGVSVRNVSGRCFSGVEVYMTNTLDTISVWPCEVTFDNITLSGYGTVSSVSRGALLSGCNGVTITRSTFDGFDYGVYPGANTKKFRLRDSTIKNSRRHGISGTETTGSADWVIEGNTFTDNNASNTGSQTDVFIRLVAGVVLNDNEFDSDLCAWNIRLDGGGNAPSRARLRGNHSDGVGAGPCYSIGGSSDTIAVEYEANTASVTPTNGVRGGQTIIGYLTSVAATPPYVGARALIAGGQAYIATGVNSAADWKQITN
ncbi:MAG TPA: right-handed parallel beta-helix repeat-containing protein [Devosia sp.]|nr:right-handed parallel beta-helix repeat-containing protein [Devosia sp.]